MDLKVIGTIAAMFALAACTTSTSDDDGTGGTGNDGGSGGTGGVVGGEGGTGGAVGGEGGEGGTGGTCVYCAQAIDDAVSPFCDTQAEDLWDALQSCICTDSCATECGDNLCSGAAAQTAECETCITDSCGTEFTECANDAS